MSILVFLFFFLLVILFVLYVHHHLFIVNYWTKRNVPQIEPNFLFGNTASVNVTENLNLVTKKFYLEHKRDKLFGFWFHRTPVLLVNDPELIRRVFIKDFDQFYERIPFDNSEYEPIRGHLFLLGGKRWRNLRVKLTPTFTSGKMKMMFPTMMKCGDLLSQHISAAAPSEISVKDLMARFSTDIIASCAFGIETNSMKTPESEFRKNGDRLVTPSWRSVLFQTLVNISPTLVKLFKIRQISKELTDFFVNLVRDTMNYRRVNSLSRNDFLQLLMQLIDQGKVEDAEKKSANGYNIKAEEYKFTELEAAAQCLVFFIAGFETSSTALTYGLYELALNPDIQTRLQKEIDDAVSTTGDVTYDKLCELPYMDMVVHEILRKYPSLPIITRNSINKYTFPETNTVIEKKTRIFVSVLGIHHDPDYYPQPEKFDPERFTAEEKKKRLPGTYFPFGDGPRICIGSRFGLLQMKIGLLSVLRNHTVQVSENTPIPYEVDKRSFFLSPKGGIPLLFKKRV